MLADFIRARAGGDPSDQVRLVLNRVFQRRPTDVEVERGRDLIDRLRLRHRTDAGRALELFCLVALNLNEFIYLD